MTISPGFGRYKFATTTPTIRAQIASLKYILGLVSPIQGITATMATVRERFQSKSWTRDGYLLSTDPSLISLSRLNEFFATEDMHWTLSMPEDQLQEMVTNSLCFGLYRHSLKEGTPKAEDLIGFARCVTDFTTLLYLTDVYTMPEIRGTGLGKWMLACVEEVMNEMPHLRRIIFITSDWERSVPFYEKFLGTSVIESRPPKPGEVGDSTAVLSKIGPGWPDH